MYTVSINSTMGDSLDTSSNRYSGGSVVCVNSSDGSSMDSSNRSSMHTVFYSHSFLVAHLAGNLLGHGVAFFAGYFSTLLDGYLNSNLLGHIDTVSDRLSHAIGLRYLSVDGNTLLNWLSHAVGLRYLSVDGCALCNRLGVASSFRDLSRDNVAPLLGYLDTHRDSCTPRYSNVAWNLDGNLTALALSDSTAVVRSRMYRNSSHRGTSKRYSWSKSTHKMTVSEKELSVSIGVSIGVSFSITLNNTILGSNDGRGGGINNSTSLGKLKSGSGITMSSISVDSGNSKISSSQRQSSRSSTNRDGLDECLTYRKSLASNMADKTR